MQKKARLFVTLGTVLILLVVTGIYLNYKMDQVVQSINRPGVLFSDTRSSTPPLTTDDAENPDILTSEPSAQIDGNEPLPRKHSLGSANKVEKDDIVSGVQQKVSRPIEKKDLVKAGLVIIRRLSWEEIEYMYDVGSKASISAADLKKVHKILNSRLSAEEIKMMQDLGRKYGKNLDFLS
jgi:hypothetical protein